MGREGKRGDETKGMKQNSQGSGPEGRIGGGGDARGRNERGWDGGREGKGKEKETEGESEQVLTPDIWQRHYRENVVR